MMAAAESARVLVLHYSDPAAYPPLEHAARLLAAEGGEVLFIGLDLFGGRFTPIVGQRIETRLQEAAPAGWPQRIAYARFVARGIWTAWRWRATAVYASDPMACPAALILRTLGWPVVYHEHDSPEPEATRSSAFLMRLVLRTRDRLAARAAACVLPNGERAHDFAAETGRDDVVTAWNCPVRAEVGPARRDRADSRLRVLYHGSIVPARLPLAVIGALARTPNVDLIVVGYEPPGHDDYLGQIQRAAIADGVADRVDLVGVVPTRAQLLDVCATCDVGLALMPTVTSHYNERTMAGASNKPFDYLARGLALLVSERPAWRALFAEAGLARTCVPESADSIAGAFHWFRDHPEERLAMGERGRQRILAEWNYDTVFAPVLARLNGGSGLPSAPAPRTRRAHLAETRR